MHSLISLKIVLIHARIVNRRAARPLPDAQRTSEPERQREASSRGEQLTLGEAFKIYRANAAQTLVMRQPQASNPTSSVTSATPLRMPGRSTPAGSVTGSVYGGYQTGGYHPDDSFDD